MQMQRNLPAPRARPLYSFSSFFFSLFSSAFLPLSLSFLLRLKIDRESSRAREHADVARRTGRRGIGLLLIVQKFHHRAVVLLAVWRHANISRRATRVRAWNRVHSAACINLPGETPRDATAVSLIFLFMSLIFLVCPFSFFSIRIYHRSREG